MNQPQPVKDASPLYEVERRAQHAARPGFRITELQLSATQKVPWHTHTNVSDTFYVLEGQMRLFLQDPKEEVNLKPGEVYVVKPTRPHEECSARVPIARSMNITRNYRSASAHGPAVAAMVVTLSTNNRVKIETSKGDVGSFCCRRHPNQRRQRWQLK